jgi:hypothetical protein
MNRQVIYCGLKNPIPQGYDRLGTTYECLKKGYGACLYNGKCGTQFQNLFFDNQYNRYMLITIIFLFFIIIVQIFIKYTR